MDDLIDRRRLITAGAAAAMVAAASGGAANAAHPDYPTATGAWGDKVSTDDYVEIQQLYAHYCHALDTANTEALTRCWTKDGEMTRGYGPGQASADRTPTSGYAMGAAMSGSSGGSRHMVTNLVLTKTPEGAKGSAYLLLYTSTTTPSSFVSLSIYDDTLVKTAEGWKFKKRVVWRDDDDISPFRPKQGPRTAPPSAPDTPKAR